MNSAVLSYTISAAAWSLFGAMVGYVMGRLDRKLDNGGIVEGDTIQARRSLVARFGPDKNTLIGIVVLVIAAASLTISGVNEASNRAFRNHNARIVACQYDYNAAVVEAMAERADAAAQDRDSLDDMIKATATATKREDVAAALQKYIRDRAEADATRARHPLPQPPNCREVQ